MKGRSMSNSFTRQNALVARESTRRIRIVINVAYEVDGELRYEQVVVPHGKTTIEVMREKGVKADSYADIEIEPVGRIDY